MLGVWRGAGGGGCASAGACARARMRGRENRVKFFLVSVKTFVEVKFLEWSFCGRNRIESIIYPIPYHAKRYIS
jgi:hypothetical protein